MKSLMATLFIGAALSGGGIYIMSNAVDHAKEAAAIEQIEHQQTLDQVQLMFDMAYGLKPSQPQTAVEAAR